MSSEKEFDLDEWSKRDRNPYFDNGLLEMGRKEGFHKGQEQAAKRILEGAWKAPKVPTPTKDCDVVTLGELKEIIAKVLEESK